MYIHKITIKESHNYFKITSFENLYDLENKDGCPNLR